MLTFLPVGAMPSSAITRESVGKEKRSHSYRGLRSDEACYKEAIFEALENFATISDTLLPPKANEFDIAACIAWP